MNLIKTHAPLHMPENIRLFGWATNFDSGPLESSHKDNCKKPTKLTQKRGDQLEAQVVKRISESYTLDTVNNMCFRPRDVDVLPTAQNSNVGGLKLFLKVSPDNTGLS
jgi:hypothetical protein